MNVREAILKAADQIEARPELFDFIRTRVPECGTPGCALGWICYYAGIQPDDHITAKVVGLNDSAAFYRRMDALERQGEPPWHISPATTAACLRRYADRHHPAEDHIPASIRAMFEVPA